jgi:hypothetical protein
VVRVPCYSSGGPRFDYRRYQIGLGLNSVPFHFALSPTPAHGFLKLLHGLFNDSVFTHEVFLLLNCHVYEPGERSRYSVWLLAGRPRGRSSSPGGIKNFHFSISFRPALGSTQLLSNGYQGLFPRGWSGRGVKLTTHLQLVPRWRKYGSTHPLPRTPSWRGA